MKYNVTITKEEVGTTVALFIEHLNYYYVVKQILKHGDKDISFISREDKGSIIGIAIEDGMTAIEILNKLSSIHKAVFE